MQASCMADQDEAIFMRDFPGGSVFWTLGCAEGDGFSKESL